MEYYAYEYSILQQLNDRLNIESITIASDTYEATKNIRNYHGKFKNVVISKINIGRTIQLDFPLDFHYRFDSKMLKDAYEQKHDSGFIVEQIVQNIKNVFVDKFLLR